MYIDYEVADKIATITLNRPEAANAQNAGAARRTRRRLDPGRRGRRGAR